MSHTQVGRRTDYNIFRWYRAGWGRYTQADPIGFEGGLNLYAYALLNPIVRADLNGLPSYKGFSPEDQKLMEEAIEKAKAKMKEKPCCYPTGPKVLEKLEKATLVYKKGLDLCGKVSTWGFVTNTIQISPFAFDPGACCNLESTLAHEANHLLLKGTEESGKELEKKCFGCGT